MSINQTQSLFKKVGTKLNNVWTFPALLTLVLTILTFAGIHGSSIGLYHKTFYGDAKDPQLLLNQPQAIRSDEWLVNSQKYIAQSNNNFKPTNKNIGLGENEIVISDNPSSDWSSVFKPQNFGFLLLPLDNGFAFKWWFLPYLLLISTYFTVLVFLRKRYLLAALISIAFTASPFLNWWYLNGTLSTISFALLGFIVLTKIANSRQLRSILLWSLLLVYVAVCFVVILYPPFQIPVALVVLAVSIGYIINRLKSKESIPLLKKKIVTVSSAVVLTGALIGAFIYSNLSTVASIQSSAYPGARIVESGGYSKEHLVTGYLGGLFQDPKRANAYQRTEISAVNQSESSNFILLIPFLLIPLAYIGISSYRRNKKIDYLLLAFFITLLVFTAWMFIPGLNFLGKITLLDKVPLQRLIIGFGVLNLFIIIYFVKLYSESKKLLLTLPWSVIYSLLIFISLLIVNFHILLRFPDFIGFKSAILLALPIPIIVFLLLRKYFTAAMIIYALFSFFSINQINPVYHSTAVLTQTPLSIAMKQVAGDSEKKWVSEDITIENFATMNGLPSITGTYLHPQLSLWSKLEQQSNQTVYNRYAHVNFTFDRDPAIKITPLLTNPGPDQMNIKIEPCDPFLKSVNVGFLVSSRPFNKEEVTCLDSVKSVKYPIVTFYIYRLK